MDLILKLRRLMLAVAKVVAFIAPVLARLAMGWLFFEAGKGKIEDISKPIAFFTDLGIPAPKANAYLVAYTEWIGGAMLIVGALTRVVSVPLIITMVVALLTAHRAEVSTWQTLIGHDLFKNIALLVYLFAIGAGPISLDFLLARVFHSKIEGGDKKK